MSSALLAKGGKLMKELQKDPVTRLPNLLGVQDAHNKTEITAKVLEMLDSDKPWSEQYTKLEEVSWIEDIFFLILCT